MPVDTEAVHLAKAVHVLLCRKQGKATERTRRDIGLQPVRQHLLYLHTLHLRK